MFTTAVTQYQCRANNNSDSDTVKDIYCHDNVTHVHQPHDLWAQKLVTALVMVGFGSEPRFKPEPT